MHLGLHALVVLKTISSSSKFSLWVHDVLAGYAKIQEGQEGRGSSSRRLIYRHISELIFLALALQLVFYMEWNLCVSPFLPHGSFLTFSTFRLQYEVFREKREYARFELPSDFKFIKIVCLLAF